MTQIDFALSDDGLLNFFDDVPEAVDRYETMIQEVQLAEELGFTYYFFIEHQNHTYCSGPADGFSYRTGRPEHARTRAVRPQHYLASWSHFLDGQRSSLWSSGLSSRPIDMSSRHPPG